MLLFLATIPTLLIQAQPTPPWWEHWKQAPYFSSAFTQEGESAAFGKLVKKGSIVTAKGGRLRVEYEKGIILLCDGSQLTQYDPSTRTAQVYDLKDISQEWPLLRLLTGPAALDQVFDVSVQNDGAIKLTPKKAGLPEVLLEGKGTFLHKATWEDGTGAKQVLTLTAPKTVSDPGRAPFTLKAPVGTKWIR
jgi:outer membrane lipoprotein-sorting protein